MLDLGHVNLWAIFFSGIAGSVFAYFWYSPRFLGKLWPEIPGQTRNDINITWVYAINFLAAFVLSYTIAQIIYFFGAKSIVTGAAVGLGLWLFFTVSTGLFDILKNKRNPAIYILNFGYQLLSMILMGGILGLWK